MDFLEFWFFYNPLIDKIVEAVAARVGFILLLMEGFDSFDGFVIDPTE
jgi:hypothetical protein